MFIRNNQISIICEVKQDKFAELNFEQEESKTYKSNADDSHNAACILSKEADKLENEGELAISNRVSKQ